MTITTEQAAFILRNTDPAAEDFMEHIKQPHCYLCREWGSRYIKRSTAEKAGLTWPDPDALKVDEDGEPVDYVGLWTLVDFGEPRFTPEDAVCVVSRRVAKHSAFAGLYVAEELAPVHLDCWHLEHLNGRRVSGLTEQSCSCGRTFYSRKAIDWCHACPRPERTCAHCTGPLRPEHSGPLAAAFGITGQQRARSHAKYCSGACRVAAHRARANR